MPFKSKEHIAKMAELEKQGKVPKGTVKKWLAETPNGGRGLPKRIGPPKSTNDLRDRHAKMLAERRKKYGI